MKKTSVYLSDEDRERLRRLAEREGVSQAMVLREAIAAYDANESRGGADEDEPPLPEGLTTEWHTDESGHRYRIDRLPDGRRYFAISGLATGDGTSAADIPEEEYLKGFGE